MLSSSCTHNTSGEAHENYQQAYDTNSGAPNEAKFSHEAIAGAASFAAFKSFEDRQRSDGKNQCLTYNHVLFHIG
jgi:hypothetical protein